MLRDISPQMAGLVSNWCNTLLYGMTVVAYAVCMFVLIKHRHNRNRTATSILIGTSTIQFILATIYVAVSLRALIEGFIHTENVQNAAFIYWISPAIKTQVIARGVYITNSVVGDFVLIWRVCMVWGKSIRVCILPIIITCLTTVTGYVAEQKLAAFSGNPQPTSLFEINNWILSTWSLSISTQVISTGLIAGRIWWHARRNPEAKARYVSVVVIIVESGAIYTVCTVLLVSFLPLKLQAGAILGHLATQVATIVPTLIIIRVELNRNKAATTLRHSDLTDNKRSAVSRSIVFRSAHQPDDLSVQDTASTVSPSQLSA